MSAIMHLPIGTAKVSRRSLKLDWSGPAGRYGALAAGLGIGLTIAGPAALSW